MDIRLDSSDADIVLTSLEFTKSAFQKASYPSVQIKRDKVKQVDRLIHLIREERKKETGK